MGKEQELLEAARTGNVAAVEKLLSGRRATSGGGGGGGGGFGGGGGTGHGSSGGGHSTSAHSLSSLLRNVGVSKMWAVIGQTERETGSGDKKDEQRDWQREKWAER
ncbi:hypothetical protein QTP70_008572 [Hemibagrus guttatus]|uniref:Uncharacterized protein n=1 Tax=Hemibagrus guttatus TaxID=175788 RepID=A0AAE0QC35_9TELE|nr:hypothetical protein QTP70_008572 [Hemibagrus guttatus]KAK3546970.1 hypothetical protein QTP86_007445 [Hemibagrus guttatus]